MPFKKKILITATGMLPAIGLIFAVLGSIILGLSAPTEAAALGAFGSIILTILYRNFSLKALQESVIETLRISSMALMILVGGYMFSGVFLGMGGGDLVEKGLLALNLGPLGVLVLFLFLVYVAGFILDWASILRSLCTCFLSDCGKNGIYLIWFGTLFIMMIQTSYLTPPMAPAIFYLRGIALPELKLRPCFGELFLS